MRDKKAVGTRITLIRNTLNETLEEFGRRFNTSKTTVYNWEIGRNLPNNQNFAILEKIAEDIGVPVERPLRDGGAMRDTAQSVYIKNTFQITDNLDKGLYEKPKELIRDLKNAQQRYKENLSRMDGRDGR